MNFRTIQKIFEILSYRKCQAEANSLDTSVDNKSNLLADEESPIYSFQVDISMLEIYNEQVSFHFNYFYLFNSYVLYVGFRFIG